MRLGEEVRTDNGFKQIQLFIKKPMTGTYPGFFKGELQGEGTYQIVVSFLPPFEGCLLIKKSLRSATQGDLSL